MFLIVGALTGSRTVGRELHQLLCLGGLYVVVRAPLLTAGVLAEERRNQTLGLLFLSGLSGGEVFMSKFLSAVLVAFTDLLAIFPMFALPFLIGGVSFDLFEEPRLSVCRSFFSSPSRYRCWPRCLPATKARRLSWQGLWDWVFARWLP